MKVQLLLYCSLLLFNVTMWLYVSTLLLYALLLELCNIAAVHAMCIYSIYLMIATLHMVTVTICQCYFISHNVTVHCEICCPVILCIYTYIIYIYIYILQLKLSVIATLSGNANLYLTM